MHLLKEIRKSNKQSKELVVYLSESIKNYSSKMKRTITGILFGFVFGIFDVLLMIPISMNDKPIAMFASFINRFAIGFFIATADIPIPSWLKGMCIGLLLSLPDAIITKAYAPIVGVGIIGGLIIGFLIKTRTSSRL